MDKISGARAPRQEVLSFMTKIDIFSGFLGAGKTTLIKKLIAEAYTGEKIVLIENEFGEIAIDGGFLKDSGVQINEMNSGCICCSLVGRAAESARAVSPRPHPHRALGRRQAERRHPRRAGRTVRRAGAQRLHDRRGREQVQDVHEKLRRILQ